MMYISPYKLIYQATKNNKPEVSNVLNALINSLITPLNVIEEKTGVHFVIVKKCDVARSLYVVENGFRKKICDITNNSKIPEILSFVMSKINRT